MSGQTPAVLISSSGAKIPLIQTFKDAANRIPENPQIFCGDTNPAALSRYFCDGFWEMQPLESYSTKALISELLSRNIKWVIPTRDGELTFWSEIKELLKVEGIEVLVSKLGTLTTTMDKLEFSQWSNRENFPVIKTWSIANPNSDEEIVIKERFAAAPKNTYIGVKESQSQALASKLSEPIFQKFMPGKEYSVDVWVHSSENIQVSARSREVIIDGEARVTRMFASSKLESLAENMARKLEINGPAVIQFIEDSAGNFLPIECNARIGGASTFSINTRHDSVYLAMCSLFGSAPHKSKVIEGKDIQVRVLKDYYF